MNYAAPIGLAVLSLLVLAALMAGRFAAFGDSTNPLSPEDLDRAALTQFYREIAVLVLGMLLGAALFCLCAGVAVAITLNT